MLIGVSKEIQDLKSFIRKAALISPDYPILITGESGVGKTLVANLIHQKSFSNKKSFVQQSCSNISETLFESELFGHERGSFTGAVVSKIGKVEKAKGGTLFLDEIAELNLFCQAKLLYFLESRKFYKVGGIQEHKVDVRIITSSNKYLLHEIEEKRFRPDLYYRISTFHFHIKPLRERKEDIICLSDYIIKMENEKNKLKKKKLSKKAMSKLIEYNYPGNIRELENILKRTYILSENEIIEEEDIQFQTIKSKNIKVEKILNEMINNDKSFWDVVHKPFLDRELNRNEVKEIIMRGLDYSKFSYKKLLPIFNINKDIKEYKRFMKVLTVHNLHHNKKEMVK